MALLRLPEGWRSGTWTFQECGDDEAWIYDGPWAIPRARALRVVVTDNPAAVDVQPASPRYAGPVPLGVWQRVAEFVRDRDIRLQQERIAAAPPVDWSRFELGPDLESSASDAGRGGHHV